MLHSNYTGIFGVIVEVCVKCTAPSMTYNQFCFLYSLVHKPKLFKKQAKYNI